MMEPRVEEFLKLCRDRGLWSIRAMVGKPAAMCGEIAVCYCGALGDCEKAENRIIPVIQKRAKEKGEMVLFCYVYPLREDASNVYDLK